MIKNIPTSYWLFNSKTLYFFLLALFIASGCSSTKSVPENDALFAGYNVKVEGEPEKPSRKALEAELDGTVRPKPNSSILGLRFKLWIYNAMGDTADTGGIKGWIKEKVGEPPVLLSQVDTTTIADVMSSRLNNLGYFDNEVGSTTQIKKKKATVEWKASVQPPYRIRNIVYPEGDSLQLYSHIRATKEESLLKVGDPFRLQTMVQERERIDNVLKNKGFFYFSPDFLAFRVDTTLGERLYDVRILVKRDAPAFALQPYKIDDIYITTNHTVSESNVDNDTLKFERFYYIPDENYVKSKHLAHGLFLERDSLYTRQNHLLTTSRLMGLGAFKFVNVRFNRDTLQENRLDAEISLTPNLKKSLRVETQYVNKSNNFAGPGITASFRNRNALRGSELLTVNLDANYETQIGGQPADESNSTSGRSSVLNSYELGIRTDLTFPRFVAPFWAPNLRSEFVPKTRISLGTSLLNRVQFFRMNSINASYSYNWRPKRTLTYEVTPINLQYVNLLSTTSAFEERLQLNPFLQRSFNDQFIIGSIYQLTISTQVYEERRHQFFDRISLDVSGNILNGLYSLTGADSPTDEFPRTIAGQPFSQYTRIENDFRYYLKFSEKSMLATRFIAGAGFTYGNSASLPYVKQFSIGGNNSIRAFRPRSIGPGAYRDSTGVAFFDQVGDIKFETNIEYRFPIVSLLRGALFVDAGNIWLLRDQGATGARSNGESGLFNAGSLINELAVGTGFGLRVDIEFFVIRLDFGIPVRVPYLPVGQRYVLDDFNFGFRGDAGMNLNIAIGYPF
ncbi:BamA/TamA family outer membrane protein [Pontibacter sp. SGAir0037]|uniref:translocation and assembly module lipoprotein TamL n=1 Tax=Pontibacter sp. SGAir0037 TaxID=2571030 RepID=UPI0010CD558A|nr:BamA/TamA family outer membrane protein [Pontibacter sp. SGAir0037]QCR23121.1 hypothetical protein C1N53_12700 [Pontibacter sp. SGAir0037]